MDYKQHRLDYCQFLISSQINYTQTHLADHSERYSHDSMNRFLRLDKLTPRTLWENVRDDIACSFLVWAHLKRLAQQRDTNVYQLKSSLLDNYMRQQLKNPSIPMVLCA